MQTVQGIQAQIQAKQDMRQQEHQRIQALHAISSRISVISDPDQILNEMVQSVRNAFGCTNALILLTDKEEGKLDIAASDHPPTSEMRERRFKIGSEGISRVASTREPLIISDISQDGSCMTSDPEIRSQMIIPMLVGGRLVGIFCVESDQTDAFEEQDLQLMTILADYAAAAIEATRTMVESQATIALEQQAHNLMLINRISTTLNSSLDAYEILDMTVQYLVELTDVDYGGVLILGRDGQHGQIIAEHPTQPHTNVRMSLPPWPSIQRALELGIPYAIEDATDHPFLETLREQIPSMTFRSLLLVSMVARRELIGILLLASSDQPRSFSDEEREICQTVASQAAVAVANARLLQDVQQQRHALTRRSQELTEASSKLDAILNNIADGLVVTDPTGCIILNNPAFREMADLPSTRSLYGYLLAELFPVAGLLPLVTQALEVPGQVFTDNLELADGRVLKTSATALRIPPPILEPEEGEQIAGVVTILRDITHEVEVDRMKTDFISAVSHELRSPLTAILGFANLIQRDFNQRIAPHIAADERINQYTDRILKNVSIIEDQSQRLTRLINDVLDIAKMEAGRMDWVMDNTDLVEVIQSAVVATTALAEENDLSIHVHLPPAGLPPVWGHRDRLVQVVTNLLSNSIKFTEQGHIKVSGKRLQASPQASVDRLPQPGTRPLGEWIIVSVTDTGIGIPAEEIPCLFEKFSQAGGTLTEQSPGTGLGLAICKEIIEHHRGRIWAESEPGKGSTFSFILPTASPQLEKTAPSISKPQMEKQQAQAWANEQVRDSPLPNQR